MIKSPEILLNLLDENELDIFTNRSFEERTQLHLADRMTQLRTLIKNGLLDIIERGKYCRHNFRNEYVISNYLTDDAVIANWTALNLHSLNQSLRRFWQILIRY